MTRSSASREPVGGQPQTPCQAERQQYRVRAAAAERLALLRIVRKITVAFILVATVARPWLPAAAHALASVATSAISRTILSIGSILWFNSVAPKRGNYETCEWILTADEAEFRFGKNLS
jgi:hypothetical protein